MAFFRLHWLDNTTTVVEGDSISKAFNSCYSGGAIQALDYYSEIKLPTEGWTVEEEIPYPRKMTRIIYKHKETPELEMIRVRDNNKDLLYKGLVRIV